MATTMVAVLTFASASCSSSPSKPPSATGTSPISTIGAASGACPRSASGWTPAAAAGGPHDQPVRFLALVPSGPARTDRPLLVLLRGSGANEQQWRQIGLAEALAQSTSALHAAAPLVITPDIASAVPSQSTVEDFLANTLLPLATRCWGATTNPTRRAIGGISAGGGTALRVAADRPDLFQVVGGHSPAVNPAEASTLAAGLIRSHCRVWLDAALHDITRPGTEALSHALAAQRHPATLHEAPGTHNRAYWHAALPDYLRFYLGALG